jgi:protein gp138/GpV-like protein with Apex motif
MQTRLWTALPCVVQSFPAISGLSQMMLDAQPCIQAKVLDSQGNFQALSLPLLVDIPILWQGGGGVSLTFPIKQGDECLVVFSSRCIDAWWQLGADNIQVPPNQRMHSLSDGFALVGVRSLPREYAVSSTYAQLRTDDGNATISIDPTTHELNLSTTGATNLIGQGATTVTAQGGITLNGVTIDKNGNVSAPGNIASAKTVTATADVQTGSISLKNHVHPGVTSGGSSTGTPVG